jgi:hypothetical protein
MVTIQDYQGREQSYVKHVFLERYLESLVHKTASSYNHIVYVDGFAGPWQSASEQFKDTSFGIALNALRQSTTRGLSPCFRRNRGANEPPAFVRGRLASASRT